MNIREAIREGKYRNDIKVPHFPDSRAYLPHEFEVKKAEWNALDDSHQKREQEIYEDFEEDCAENTGMKEHPKRTRIFEKAWEYGHSNGLEEVLWWYEELSELLR